MERQSKTRRSASSTESQAPKPPPKPNAHAMPRNSAKSDDTDIELQHPTHNYSNMVAERSVPALPKARPSLPSKPVGIKGNAEDTPLSRQDSTNSTPPEDCYYSVPEALTNDSNSYSDTLGLTEPQPLLSSALDQLKEDEQEEESTYDRIDFQLMRNSSQPEPEEASVYGEVSSIRPADTSSKGSSKASSKASSKGSSKPSSKSSKKDKQKKSS